MSQENVEIVRRDIAARDARDWTDLAEIWHPDIELKLVRGGGTYRGLDEITDFFDTLSGLHADYRVEADELLDAGEQVVTVERVSGRGLKGSDADGWIGETLFRVIRFKEGAMWRVTEYPSRSQALEAAGLRE
jgi:ketosteroid isomerase-like protein